MTLNPPYDIEQRKLDMTETIQQDDPFTDEIIAQVDKITGKNYSDSPSSGVSPSSESSTGILPVSSSTSELIADPFTDDIIAEVDKITGKKYADVPADSGLDFSAQPTAEYIKAQQKAKNWQTHVQDISGNNPMSFTVQDPKTGKNKIVPFKITGTDQRSLMGNMAESLVRNNEDLWRNVMDSVNAIDESIDPASKMNSSPYFKLVSQYRKLQEKGDSVKADNWFSEQLHNTAGMLPGLFAGYMLNRLTPGAGLGMWTLQGAGDTYRDLVDDKVDPRIALAVSAPVGVIYGAIENLQVDQIGITGKLKETLYEGLNKIAKDGIKKVVKEYGLNVLKEAGEEMLQEATQVAGEYIAKGANDLVHDSSFMDTKFKGEYKDDLKRIAAAFYTSIVPMAITSLPFHAYQGTRAINSVINRGEGNPTGATDIEGQSGNQPPSPTMPTLNFNFNGQQMQIQAMLNPETKEWFGIIPGHENAPMLLGQKYQDQLNQQYGPESSQSSMSPSTESLIPHAQKRVEELSAMNPGLMSEQEQEELAALQEAFKNPDPEKLLAEIYPLAVADSPSPAPLPADRETRIKQIAAANEEKKRIADEKKYYANMNPTAKDAVENDPQLNELGIKSATDIPPGFKQLFKEAGTDPKKITEVLNHIEANLKDKKPIPPSLSNTKPPSSASVKTMDFPDVNTLSLEDAQKELDTFDPKNYTPGMAGARKEQLNLRMKDLRRFYPEKNQSEESDTDKRSESPDDSKRSAPALEHTKRSHHAQPVKVTDLTSTPKEKTNASINRDLNEQDVEEYAKETGQTKAEVKRQAEEFDSLLESSADFANHFMEGNRGEQLKSARKAAASLLSLPNTIEIQSPAERAKALPALKKKLASPSTADQQSKQSAADDSPLPSDDEGDISFDPEELDRQVRNLAATSKGSGITPAQIQPIINKISRRWDNAPKIQIVRYLTDLPIDLKKALLSGGVNPRGVYFGRDGVFLVSDNLENVEDSGFVLLHESVGHYGLRGVFGNQLDPALAEIFRTNPDIRTKAMEMIRANRNMSQIVATEEVISDMAGKFQGWQRLAYAIRKALRKMGLVNTYENDKVWDIIEQSRKFVKSGKPDAKIGSANASKESGIGVPPVSSPRLSPAQIKSLSELIDQFKKEVDADKLSKEQKGIYDVVIGDRDETAIRKSDLDSLKNYVILESGDRKEGSKHIVVIHYGGLRGKVTAAEILNMGEVIRKGELVKGESNEINHVYKLKKEDGLVLTLIALKKRDGDETVLSFYSNRKTPIGGHNASSAKGLSDNNLRLSSAKSSSDEKLYKQQSQPVLRATSEKEGFARTSENVPAQTAEEVLPSSENTIPPPPEKSSPEAENSDLRLSPKTRYENPDQLNFFNELDNPQTAEPAAVKTNAIAPASSSSPSSMSSPIEDFGQKIGGARKDYYAQYGSNMQIAKQKDIATNALSEVFPEPDYQKLIDGGLNPEIAGFIKAMRDVIPNKPRGWKARHYMQRYVDSVTQIRDFSEKLISGERSFETTKEKIKEYPALERQIADKAELYAAVGLDSNLKDYNVGKGLYSVYAGVTLDRPMEKWSVSKDFRIVADGNTKAEAIANFAEYMKKQTPKEKTKGGTSFDVWQTRRSEDYKVGKKIAAGKFVTLQSGFKTAREAFDYIKANQSALETQLEKLKEIPDERAATNADRIGTDYRQGKDVTPDMFQNQFGFKGVEFGNWVEQERRQEDLNNAFDALMDMANVLNVPPKALSLNGKLGIGFGSRGTGGVHPAKAHYEPDFIVINLTKNNGPGSLAHEFWHALDNYFENQRGNVGKYMSENTYPRITRDGKADATRPEMLEAFKRINDAISSTGLVERSERADSTRTKDYWSTTREMTARAFEWWVKDRLASQNSQNDYLVNFLDEDAYSVLTGGKVDMFPYVNKSESKIISDAFDNFFSTIKTKEEEGRVMLFSPAKKNTTSYSAWPENFPRTVVMTTGAKLTSHPDHEAAKKGDRDAAARLVEQLSKQDKIMELGKKYPDAIVVPVHAEERTGRNQIPRKFADYIGVLTGLEVDDTIVQANTVGHTGATAIERLGARAKFAGTVIPGKEYILVDDFSTQGGSFSELRAFIETHGGKTVQAVAISASSDAQTGYSGDLAIKKETLLALSEKFGYNKLSEFLKEMEIVNGNPDALTNSEGKLLLLYSRLETARDRIIAARLKRKQETQSRILEERQTPEQQSTDSGKIDPDLRLSPVQQQTPSPIIPQSQKYTFDPEKLRTINNEIYKKAVEDKKKYYMELRRNANLAPSSATAKFVSQLGAPISTRLGNISPTLKRALRNFEFKLNQAGLRDVETMRPFLTGIRSMNSDDRLTFDLARKNADSVKVAELVKKYNLQKAYEAYRKTMDDLHVRAQDVGFDVKYLEEYHPRQVKDKAGLLMFLRDTEDWGNISKAFDEKTKELGRPLSEGEKADIANSVLRGYGPGLKLGGPGNLKSRKIAFITNELNKFYHDSDTALMSYVERVNNAIETRRFFGKSEGKMTVDLDIPEVEKSIGEYVRDLVNKRIITEAQENEVASILQARFGYMAMGRNLGFLRDLGFLTTLGSVASTITQFADLAFTTYMSGMNLDLPIKNFSQATFNSSSITRADIGIDRYGEEFRSITKLNKTLQTVFNTTGFTAVDRIGKETLVNTVVDKMKREARSGNLSKDTSRRLEEFFGPNSQDVIEDLKGEELTDNIKLLAFNILLDFQPVAQSEMTELYLKYPNGRLIYMLKTFFIKQIDVFRRECITKMTSGKTKGERIEGFRNLMHLTAVFVMANASCDIIKDLIFGRKTEPEDYVIDNMLRLIGISRYVAWQARTEGVTKAAMAWVAPPFDFVESPFKDSVKAARAIAAGKTGDFQIKDLQTWRTIPWFGQMYYWWFGAGHEKTERKEALANPDHKEIMRISQRVAGGAKTSDLDYKDRMVFARNRTEIINRAREYRRTAKN